MTEADITKGKLLNRMLDIADVEMKIFDDGTVKNRYVLTFVSKSGETYDNILLDGDCKSNYFSHNDRILFDCEDEDDIDKLKGCLLDYIGKYKYSRLVGIRNGKRNTIFNIPEFDSISELTIKLDVMDGGCRNRGK